MGRRLSGMAVAASLMLICVDAAAADWWVDAAAADGGDGSADSPFRAINDVKTVLQTGDTVWIADGTYAETVDFWHVPDGTGGRTTIRAAPGASPVIDGGGAAGFVLQAGETPNMTFQGLTVTNGDTGIEFYQADGGEVIDCTTESTGGSVAFYFASHGRVSGSKLEGSVSGKASDGTVVEDSEIYGSGAEGISLHADSKNCRFSRNVVHDNTSVNIYLDSISDTIVDSNLVYMTLPTGKTTVGIMLADESYPNVTAPVLQNITITNNVVIDNESGIRFWDGNFPGESALRNVVIANNTVIDNSTTAIKWDAGPHQNTVVQNNIFAGEAGKQLLLLQANSTTGVSLDHNLWYLPDVPNPLLWGSTSYDHPGWAAATGHGAGDVLADPRFVGEWARPAANLELSDGSPAIDAGVALADVSHDFVGASRPAGGGYDLGALEYGALPRDGGATVSGGGGAGNGGTTGDGGAGNSPVGGTGNDVPEAGTVAGAADAASAAGGGGNGGDSSSNDSGGCGCRIERAEPRNTGYLGALLLALSWQRRKKGPPRIGIRS